MEESSDACQEERVEQFLKEERHDSLSEKEHY